MIKHDIPELNTNELRQFGLILSGLLILIFGFYMPWIWGWKLLPNYYWIFTGVCIALWSIIRAESIVVVYRLWMHLSLRIGGVINIIILFLLYFIIITPIGMVIKLLGYDPMFRNFDPNVNSYRIKSRITEKDSFERPY